MADSQAVKNTYNASVDSKGFCFYQATNGIKRHLAVATLGFPFFTLCTPANISGDMGWISLLILNIQYFKSKPVNISKITLLLDNGCHLDKLTKTLEAVYPGILRKVKFEPAFREPCPHFWSEHNFYSSYSLDILDWWIQSQCEQFKASADACCNFLCTTHLLGEIPCGLPTVAFAITLSISLLKSFTLVRKVDFSVLAIASLLPKVICLSSPQINHQSS